MKKVTTILILALVFSMKCFAQPWKNPLNMAWSTDGITFGQPVVFQDSSGVPSVIRWKGDTLICAFQWFRQPNPSPSWDRVATKISYDNGLNWSQPTPIVINGLPAGYQRPFDPTLAVFSNDSIRIYFSSSAGMPAQLDSTVNTYSAVSADGINFYFEPNARVDEFNNRVIDPAVIYFGIGWHYISPIGAPQDGAYHYVSPDGINFNAVPTIPSDNTHNWTGNFMMQDSTELRFYGCGQNIWYNSTSNGGVWDGYTNTNVQGGDPSVVKISNNNYLMIYVGPPYWATEVKDIESNNIHIYPNPVNDFIQFSSAKNVSGVSYIISDISGRKLLSGKIEQNIDIRSLPKGIYILQVSNKAFKVVKQ